MDLKIFFKVSGIFFFCVGIVALFIFSLAQSSKSNIKDPNTLWKTYEHAVITMPQGGLLSVVLADTPEKREQGLSFTSYIPEGYGMLFVFESPDYYSFWMKDMHYDLDILWIDSDGKVVHVVESASPDSYPTAFTSPEKALYVLEIPAGSCKEKYVCHRGMVFQMNSQMNKK